jgi:hypothetical protein
MECVGELETVTSRGKAPPDVDNPQAKEALHTRRTRRYGSFQLILCGQMDIDVPSGDLS